MRRTGQSSADLGELHPRAGPARPGDAPRTMVPSTRRPGPGTISPMPDAVRPLLELSVFAAALMVAGLLALLQCRPERIPEWPPSPPPSPRRREFVATLTAGTLLLTGVL